MMLKGMLDLHIPHQHLPRGGELDTRTESLQTWIAALPLASTKETSRLVFDALTAMNRTPMITLQRYKALELFGAPVRYIRDALKNHYIKSHLPLLGKTSTVATLVRDLESEIAVGYKIVVTEFSARERARQETEALAIAAHRAMFYLGHVLVTSYQIYTPPPARVWQELHDLYRYSELQQFHRTAVTSSEIPSISSSMMVLYQQIQLLALVDPYCLTQEETGLISQRLNQNWAVLCDLGPVSEGRGLYLHLDGDLPPQLTTKRMAPPATSRCLITTELLDMLQREVAQTTLQDTTQPHSRLVRPFTTCLASQLVQRLLRAWGGTSRRLHSRIPQINPVHVTFGLSATHHVISHPPSTLPQTPKGLSLDQPSIPVPRDVWNKIYDQPGTETGTMASQPRAPQMHFPLQPNRYTAHTCQFINEGPGGACIRWPSGNTPTVGVGEIIALRHPEAGIGVWEVGVIRWIKQKRDQPLEFGVQLLAPQAVPVTTLPDNGKDLLTDALCSLLLPELKAVGFPATLVTPNFLYRCGDILTVTKDGKEQRIRLTRILDSTATYTRFGYTRSEQNGQGRPLTVPASGYESTSSAL